MRSKSQQLMNEISDYVDQYYSERHTAPSVNEIAKGVGIAKTTSYRYLVAMNDLGMLRYDGASRTITTRMISKFSESTVPAPVVGAIPCGTPEEEEENIQEYVSLPVSLFGKGEFYILKASGDSMVDAGIEDGDLVVIRKQPEAMIGDIVVALDETGSNTLKKYGGLYLEETDGWMECEKCGNVTQSMEHKQTVLIPLILKTQSRSDNKNLDRLAVPS